MCKVRSFPAHRYKSPSSGHHQGTLFNFITLTWALDGSSRETPPPDLDLCARTDNEEAITRQGRTACSEATLGRWPNSTLPWPEHPRGQPCASGTGLSRVDTSATRRFPWYMKSFPYIVISLRSNMWLLMQDLIACYAWLNQEHSRVINFQICTFNKLISHKRNKKTNHELYKSQGG